LLVTNVFAVKWRRRREVYRVMLALAAMMPALDPVCELVISIAKTLSPRVPAPAQARLRLLDDHEDRISIDQLYALLDAAELMLKTGLPPYLPSVLKVSPPTVEALSRHVRFALLRLSAVHEFVQITSYGEALIEAIDKTFLCEVAEGAAEDFRAEFRVEDTKASYRIRCGLRDIQLKDAITIQRGELISWTLAILEPLRDLLDEINFQGKRGKDGIIEDDSSLFMPPLPQFRTKKPRPWSATSDSAQAGDEAGGR
jgi:hypothetical protein